ncbi:MAG: hypothetical protein AB7G28_13235 [Pirellulales bacterium]
MYASFHKHDLTCSDLFRDVAALSAGVLGAIWAALVVKEMVVSHEVIPNEHSALQGLALAVVFGAYIVGWRHGVWGATLAVLGTAALFAFAYSSVGVLPPLAAAWFAVPGVMYLLAVLADRRQRAQAPTRRDDSAETVRA